MIPDEIMNEIAKSTENISEIVNKWAVDEVYTRWETFAVDTARFAYMLAIKKASEESDDRIAQMKDYIENLVEFHEAVINGKEKDIPVYMPGQKDMR